MSLRDFQNGFRLARLRCFAVACLATCATAAAQAPVVRQPAVAPPQTAPAASDPALDVARQWIGRALILRGCYAANDLSFNAMGQLAEAPPRLADWTLAGVNLEKVARTPEGLLELEGTRVAIRYNPDQRQFERHPQKDEHLRIRIAAPAGDQATTAALTAIFSTGMDPAFEHAVPAPWLHYFLPANAWPPDDLTTQTIYGINGKFPPDVSDPVPEKKPEPSFTGEAQRDRVKGTVVVRMVVDPTGTPRRIVILQPLGYGLDARVVEAVSRYRFRPAMKAGQPVAAEVTLRQAFDSVPPAPR